MNGNHTGPINLGNPNEFTIRAGGLVRVRSTGLQLVERPLPQDDPQQRQPAVDLARQQLDWQPTVSLEQGLAPTIDSFRNLLELAEGRDVTIQRICCIVRGMWAARPWRSSPIAVRRFKCRWWTSTKRASMLGMLPISANCRCMNRSRPCCGTGAGRAFLL